MKIFKWLIIVLLVLVVLAAAGVGILVSRFDPNDYKTQIAGKVEEKTGRSLDISGDIKWSFYPKLGLSLGQTALANAEGFGDTPFASIDEADIYVAVLPLIKKQIRISTVKLAGVHLNLQKNAAGKDNWSDLSAGSEAPPATESTTTGGSMPDLDLSVGGLLLKNARLTYTDEQSGTALTIDPLNVKTGALIMGQVMPVEIDLKLIMDGIEVIAETDGDLTMDLNRNQLHYDSELKGDVVLAQKGGAIRARIKSRIIADPLAGEYRLDISSLDSDIEGADYPGGKLTTNLAAEVKANTETQLASIQIRKAGFSDIALKGNLEVKQFIDAPTYYGKLNTNQFDPRKVMQALGVKLPQTSEKNAFSQASLEMTLSGDTSSVRVKPLEATLDQSTLSGEFRVDDIKKMSLRYDLTIDRLNADHYLPVVTENDSGAKTGSESGKSAPSSESSPSSDDAITLPVDMIRSLDVAGTARINEFIINKLIFTNASLSLKAINGKVDMAPLSADAYQGKAVINASLDVKGKMPVYRTDIKLNGVRSEDILKTLFDDPYVSGSTDFNADVKTQGESVTRLKQNLQGNWNAKFSEGTIYGSKLAAKINEAQNALRKLQGKPALDDKTPKETEFSLFTASGDIKQGIVNNQDMKIIAPQFNVKGKGRVELPASSLDYTVAISRPETDDAKRLFLPLRVHGPFSDLKFGLKLDALAKQRLNIEKDKLKQELDAKKDKAKAELKEKQKEKEAELKEKYKKEEDKLKEKLNKGLGDLFKKLGN